MRHIPLRRSCHEASDDWQFFDQARAFKSLDHHRDATVICKARHRLLFELSLKAVLLPSPLFFKTSNMAVMEPQTPFNALPHIDTLIKRGVRSVQDDLPVLPGTLWSLKHKHFDMAANEVLLFEVQGERIDVSVTAKSEVEGLYPCQALYVDGKWEITGYSTTKCELFLPNYEGSGMVTAELKQGRWMEYTRAKSRTQFFEAWDGTLEEATDVVVTALGDKTLGNCKVCTVDQIEHLGG